MSTAARKDTRLSLLVVEDEPMLLAMLREYFERQGYAVFTARGVDKALDLLSTGEVDIVLSDLCLGDLRDGGLSVAAAASSAGIPVMLITAFPDDTLQRDPRFGRVGALVHKPASCRAIQNTLMALLATDRPPMTDAGELIREYAPWMFADVKSGTA